MSAENRIRDQGPGVSRSHPPHPAGDGNGRSAQASTPPRDGRSVGDLLRELSTEGADLVRQEVALAKTEMNEKLDLFQRKLTKVATGGAFLLAALLFFLWAVNSGLTALLAEFMDVAVAVWLSPLILAVVLGLVGRSMIRSATGAMKDEGVAPTRTKQTLEEDKRWAEQKAHQVKEEVTHG